MDAQLLVKLVPDEIRYGYTFTRQGMVKGPGKFKGESIATLYYYDQYGNGGDTIFEISDEERKAFDIGAGYTHVYLYESEQGFCHLYFCTSLAEAEEMESDEFEDIDEWSEE